MNAPDPAAQAFEEYAVEARRRGRIETDPLASPHQIARQRQRTQEAFDCFWVAFTGRPRSRGKGLSLATVNGKIVLADPQPRRPA